MDEAVGGRWERIRNMSTFLANCKNPAIHANHPSCAPHCNVGQRVKMGKKPKHSRALTDMELKRLCNILLSMIDPDCYDRHSPTAKKISQKAHQMLYPKVKQIIVEDLSCRVSCTW
eukprot:4588687-Amphidinium_carterae.1